MIKDWFTKFGSKAPSPASGGVVEAGIPQETRVDELPLGEAEFLQHFHAFGDLPQDERVRTRLLQVLRHPDFLQALPRGTAEQLLAPGSELAAAGVAPEPLMRFLQLMHGEITRHMYIEAAARRVGAKGIRFLLPEDVAADPDEAAIVQADRHGLGAGGYPFHALPGNPHPGRPVRYYVRVIL